MKISTLMVLILGFVLSPVAMAASTAPTSGLLITHVNSQQWQIRLVSGTRPQRFSGVMDSNMAITGVQTVKLESAESANFDLQFARHDPCGGRAASDGVISR